MLKLGVPDTVGLSTAVSSIAINASGYLFVGTETVGNGGVVSPEGVYRSENNGSTWTAMKSSSEAPLGPVYGIDSKGEIFIQGNPGEYLSTNNGNSWSEIRIDSRSAQYDPGINSFFRCIGATGYIFVALDGGSSLLGSSSYGRGTSWYDQGVDNSNPFVFPTFVAYNPAGNFFAGTNSALYESQGATGEYWGTSANNAISGAPALGNSVHFGFNSTGYGNNSTIIVGGGGSDGSGGGGLFLSTDNGTQWTTITPPAANSNTIFALAIGPNGNIFAGMSTGGISVSADTGQTWTDISVAPGLPVNTLAIYNGAVYAGTNSGVFQYQFESDGVATASAAPSSLTLDQNTPNPVSSSTNIQFSVPDAGPVSLRVFDVTGREVATVASGFYAPGTYNISLDAHQPYGWRVLLPHQSPADEAASHMFVIEH